MKTAMRMNVSLTAAAIFLWAGAAQCHTNGFGGSTTGSFGQGGTHTNMYGGSTSGTYGQGGTHTNTYGGSTSGAYGQGATHTYQNGASVYHPPGYGYPGYHPPPPYAGYPGYPAYHPPVAVPYYAPGCYGCAAAAGAVAGAAVGVAVGAAAASAPPPYPVGSDYATLPPGSTAVSQGGAPYYVYGNVWFQPVYGANGVYYVVVPAP